MECGVFAQGSYIQFIYQKWVCVQQFNKMWKVAMDVVCHVVVNSDRNEVVVELKVK